MGNRVVVVRAPVAVGGSGVTRWTPAPTVEDRGRTVDRVTRYQLAKRRMVAVVRSLSEDDLDAVCPACPAWSIRDVVAHTVHAAGAYTDGVAPPENVTGFVEPDAAKRHAAGVLRDEWTESGVLERRGVRVSDLLDEWKGVVQRMDTGDDVSLFDLVVHLGDVVEAFGDRRGVDTELAENALRTCYEFALTRRLAAIGESMVLVCSDTGLRVGAFPGAAEVRGSTYELHRTLAGRRTRAEADATLDWGTASAEARELFAVYPWPTVSAVA